ncbi:hypothetical protein LIER_07713 [Lithospermum erythrorhizon]|uniref:Integrase catalytic domain-containing protein n=1 Tax=Lithospermum erythrorhizon TaxID=34254 RepID=A0AAV3P9U2_LITER
MRCHAKAVQISQGFKRVIFEHIPRAENERIVRLSMLATTYYSELPEGVYIEICEQPAYKEEAVKSVVGSDTMDWRNPITKYLTEGIPPSDGLEAEKDATAYVKKCDACQRIGNAPQLPTSSLTLVVSPIPFAMWGIDLVGNYLEPKEELSSLLWQLIISSNNGPQFEGQVLADFCEKFGIEHRFAPVYYPQANGQVEVMNRIIFKGIKKNILQSSKGRGSWIEELPTVCWSLRATPNQATVEAPFSLVYGTERFYLQKLGLKRKVMTSG